MPLLHIFVFITVTVVHPIWRPKPLATAFNCNGTIMSTDDEEEALNLHNVYRSSFQWELTQDYLNQTYPTAKNMYVLAWNCDYEKIADSIVQGCRSTPPTQLPTDHAVNFNAFPYDNGAIHFSIIFDSIFNWTAEKENLTAASNIYNSKIKSLSNVLNTATFTVGCSAQSCGGGIIGTVACVYEQPELRDGEAMYEKGPPCENPSDCTARTPAICDTNQRLCVVENSTTTTSIATTTSMATTTSSPIPLSTTNAYSDTGINRICPANNGMNDRIRVKAVEMHNYRRSQLARGAVAKFNGNYLPSAANMVKLTYDCGLEGGAFAHAATCSHTYSNRTTREGVEENIQLVPATSAVPYRVDAVGEAIKTWWRQIRLQTLAIGMAVTFKENHVNQPISYFTMMAWATTTRLGCGVARCGANFFVVCHYRPGGNIVRSRVYDPGEPCSKCPTDTYCVSPLCNTV